MLFLALVSLTLGADARREVYCHDDECKWGDYDDAAKRAAAFAQGMLEENGRCFLAEVTVCKAGKRVRVSDGFHGLAHYFTAGGKWVGTDQTSDAPPRDRWIGTAASCEQKTTRDLCAEARAKSKIPGGTVTISVTRWLPDGVNAFVDGKEARTAWTADRFLAEVRAGKSGSIAVFTERAQVDLRYDVSATGDEMSYQLVATSAELSVETPFADHFEVYTGSPPARLFAISLEYKRTYVFGEASRSGR